MTPLRSVVSVLYITLLAYIQAPSSINTSSRSRLAWTAASQPSRHINQDHQDIWLPKPKCRMAKALTIVHTQLARQVIAREQMHQSPYPLLPA